MTPARSIACWLPFLLVALTSPLSANPQAERAELARRLRDAQHAVVGTVIDVQPRLQRNRYGDELIVSRVRVQVGEVLRGAAPAEVSVDVEGGTLNGITLKVSHVPEMRRGERAVLLLRSDTAGRYELSEGGMGILPVGEGDTIVGSGLRLDDVRQAALEVR
jgi:hypothetical protein